MRLTPMKKLPAFDAGVTPIRERVQVIASDSSRQSMAGFQSSCHRPHCAVVPDVPLIPVLPWALPLCVPLGRCTRSFCFISHCTGPHASRTGVITMLHSTTRPSSAIKEGYTPLQSRIEGQNPRQRWRCAAHGCTTQWTTDAKSLNCGRKS